MYSRKRFDIGWGDLAAGLAGCATTHGRRRAAERIERWFDGGKGDALACLSVRSGLDLYLEVLALPAGTEVLMSALTIPDMARVIEKHGLLVVPVDVDSATLAPCPEAWKRAAGPKARLAILAHLFGTRVPLDPLVELRKERGILVLEDCAQAFTGPDWKGDPRADVSMFSFGPIKTATALGGRCCASTTARSWNACARCTPRGRRRGRRSSRSASRNTRA
jgi:dTDP-4-amino-4,6-dideoxygalactose transaminase